jgi:hypothetical protein
MDFIFILLIILSFPISHYIISFIHSHHPAGHLHPLLPERVPAASDPRRHLPADQRHQTTAPAPSPKACKGSTEGVSIGVAFATEAGGGGECWVGCKGQRALLICISTLGYLNIVIRGCKSELDIYIYIMTLLSSLWVMMPTLSGTVSTH